MDGWMNEWMDGRMCFYSVFIIMLHSYLHHDRWTHSLPQRSSGYCVWAVMYWSRHRTTRGIQTIFYDSLSLEIVVLVVVVVVLVVVSIWMDVWTDWDEWMYGIYVWMDVEIFYIDWVKWRNEGINEMVLFTYSIILSSSYMIISCFILKQ